MSIATTPLAIEKGLNQDLLPKTTSVNRHVSSMVSGGNPWWSSSLWHQVHHSAPGLPGADGPFRSWRQHIEDAIFLMTVRLGALVDMVEFQWLLRVA